jgi:hypothetical protein
MCFRSTRTILIPAIILAFTAAAALYAGGSPSSSEGIDVFTGRIAVKGTEPHTFVSLTTDDGRQYRLTGEAVEELRAEYQNTVVSVRGRVLDSPGEPLPARLEVISFSVP